MSLPRRSVLALISIGTLILVWGSTWSVIQVGLRDMPPMTGIALRFGLASLLLLGLAWHRGVALGRTRIERRLWVVNSVFSFSISYGVVYWAEQWISSGLAAVLFATFPLWVAILAHYWIPGEHLTARGLLGVVIGFAGVVWIFADDLGGGHGDVTMAASIMLLSPVAAAIGSVAIKRWGRQVHPLSLTAIPMGLCSLTMAVLAWILERDMSIVWSTETIVALLYLAIAGSAVTFTLYFWLLQFVPLTRLSLITYCVPVVAVTIGISVMGDTAGRGTIAGTLLILGGVSLAITGRGGSATRPGGAAST